MTDLNAIQAAVQRAAAFQRHADENGYGQPTWYTVSGWTRAHRSRGQMTTCGRGISGPLVEAPTDMPRCGQCTRRVTGRDPGAV